MKASHELDVLIAEKVMGWTCRTPSSPRPLSQKHWYRPGSRHPVVLPAFSRDVAAAWQVVERMHAGIDPAEQGRYNYLTLVCTGHYGANWCASFDFNLSHDWFEADVLPSCPFAAQANTAPLAICLAALKTVGEDAR